MIKHSACLALSCLFGSLPLALSAQANDNCTNATTITVGLPGSCPGGAITGNNSAATDSNSPPSCDPSNNGYQDVWYTFNTGSNTEISVTLAPLTATDWNYVIYDGCSGTELVCVTVPTGTQTYTATPNSDFILQVESNLDFGVGGTFQLCIEGNSGGAAPANDECSSATVLTMGTSCNLTTTTAINATVSSQSIWCVPAPNEDVWFSFVANSTEVYVEVVPTNLMDPVLSMYSGSCPNVAIMECTNNFSYGEAEYLNNIPVLIGQTYRLRVHDYWSMATDLGFGICVWGVPPPPPAPANDECTGAITVPMLVACAPQTFDGYGATQGPNSSSCNWGSDDDVWFTFVATSGDVRITVDGNGTGANAYDPVVNLAFSTNCSSFNPIACADDTGPGGTEVLEYSGINPGSSYYVQVYDVDDTAPTTSTFTLCVQDIGIGAGIAKPMEDLSAATLHQDPADGRITAVVPISGQADWLLMDMTGRVLERGSYPATAGAPQRLHHRPLPCAAYTVVLSMGQLSRAMRIVVQ